MRPTIFPNITREKLYLWPGITYSFICQGDIIWDRGDNFSKCINRVSHRGASHLGNSTGNLIIYVVQWWHKYHSKGSLIKHSFHDVISLWFYDHKIKIQKNIFMIFCKFVGKNRQLSQNSLNIYKWELVLWKLLRRLTTFLNIKMLHLWSGSQCPLFEHNNWLEHKSTILALVLRKKDFVLSGMIR